MKRIALITFVFLILVVTPFNTTAAPIYGEEPEEPRPTLTVRKWLSSYEILLGESITVHVNITNISNHYAENLTIVEPTLSNITVDINYDYEKYTYLELGKGTAVNYSYVITPKVAGTFRLEPTTVDYVDVNGSSFSATSSKLDFKVLEEPNPVDVDDLWIDLTWMASIIVLVPMLVFVVNYVWKRS